MTTQTKESKAAALRSALSYCTGSESFFRHALSRRVIYTEGAQLVAEQAGAYWMLDEIALNCLHQKKLAPEEFQVWKFTCDPDGPGGNWLVTDGNDKVLYQKKVDYTDFCLPEITFWVEPNHEIGGRTIYLPSEH